MSKTVKNICSTYVNEMTTSIKDNKIDKYRVNVKITFEVGDLSLASGIRSTDCVLTMKKTRPQPWAGFSF